jgi:two-component system cell cycle response regulator
LKFVNDNFGHGEGDNMIKLFYKTSVNAFKSKAKTYRLGGDEFTFILDDMKDDSFKQTVKVIKLELKELSKDLDYDIEIGIGSDIFYKQGTEKIKEFIDRVDKLMYENKKCTKQKGSCDYE